MSSSSSSSTILTSSQIPTVIPISNIVSLKLTQDNYPLWKTQLLHYFRGQDLYGYLDGTLTLPPKIITTQNPDTGAITQAANPAHSLWLRQDSLILSTLMSSMTESVLAQIVAYDTSHQVWQALETNFSSKSRARTIQIRAQLATAKKTNQSANEYFLFIKKLTDELAMAGQPLRNDEIISYILAGLGHEYDGLVSSIYTRNDPISIEEIYSLLMVTESRYDRLQLSAPASLAEANIAQHQRSTFHPKNRYNTRGRSRLNTYRGGGNFSYNQSDMNSSSTLICQVCGKQGHSAKKCYHRFDVTYQQSSSSPQKHALIATHNEDKNWHADTGATHHITHDLNNLNIQNEDYTGSDQVQVGNGQGLLISKTGNSLLHTSSHSFALNDILLVPQIYKNLLSVQKFCIDNHVFFEFHGHYFLVKAYSGTILHRGHVSNGLYQFTSQNHPPQALSSVRSSFDQWHRRLGHASSPVILQILKTNKLPVDKTNMHHVCSDCQLAKCHALPFKTSNYVSQTPLDLIFTDVWGPASVNSTTGARYYVSFIDNFSKFLWLFPMKLKSDVENIFLQFQAYVEKQFSHKIKAIQSDWGGEYRRLHNYFQNVGIAHRIACPHTHQQIGTVERKHRHIVEVGLSLLSHSHLPQTYWEDAFNTATFLINRLPTPTLNNISPYEKLYNRTPDFSFLRTFGCACWPNLRPYNKHKLDFRSKSCIFIGYSNNHHGYKCLDLSTGRIYISRHVIFD